MPTIDEDANGPFRFTAIRHFHPHLNRHKMILLVDEWISRLITSGITIILILEFNIYNKY